MGDCWRYSIVLLQADGSDAATIVLQHMLASCATAPARGGPAGRCQLVPLLREDLKFAPPPELDAKGKPKPAPVPLPMSVQLQQRVKQDEEAGLAARAQRRLEAGLEAAPRDSGLSVGGLLPVPSESTAPDVLYLLSDFPATVDEANELLRLGDPADKTFLDSVIQLVWRKPGGAAASGAASGAGDGVPAFSRLPHLEEARAAVAAARVRVFRVFERAPCFG